MRLYSSLMAQAPVLNLGALPAYNAPFKNAGVPTTLATNAVIPSSGNAELRLCYAGAGSPPRYVYRKGKPGELPLHKGRRVENKWTSPSFSPLYAGNGVAPTITTGRPDAFGGTTAVRIQASRVTQDSVNYSGAAVSITAGDMAPPGGSLCVSYFARANGAPCTVFFSAGINSGTGATIVIGTDWMRVSPGAVVPVDGVAHNVQILAYLASASLAIDIDVCGIQVEDLTGTDRTAPSEYVDPAGNYGFGCLGVRWLSETCGNTIDGSYRVIETAGVALSPPMGMLWQPAATNTQTYSPPNTGDPGAVRLTFAAAAPVAGLPAVRMTATAVNGIHSIDGSFGAAFSGHVKVRLVFRKNALARPHLFVGNNTWFNYIQPNSDYSAAEILNEPAHSEVAALIPLGNDCFEMYLSAIFSNETGPAFYFRIAKNDNTELYTGAGEYLDVAAFDVVKEAYSGTPLLGVGAATARAANDSNTGLPAIGTSPFTAFIDFLAPNTPSGIAWPLFSGHDGPETGYGIGAYLFGGFITFVYGTQGLTALQPINTRTRMVLRYDGVAASIFMNGSLVTSNNHAPYNGVGSPKFGARSQSYFPYGGVLHYENRLFYTALSDSACIAMTAG